MYNVDMSVLESHYPLQGILGPVSVSELFYKLSTSRHNEVDMKVYQCSIGKPMPEFLHVWLKITFMLSLMHKRTNLANC